MLWSKKQGFTDKMPLGYQMTLTAEEYRAALAALGLQHAEFGRLVGVDPRTERRWSLAEVPVPGPVVLLVRMFQARPELLAVARAMLPPETRKPPPRKTPKSVGAAAVARLVA